MFAAIFYFSVITLLSPMARIAVCDPSEGVRMALGVLATHEEFPYLCTVVYRQDFVGACSILTEEFVIVSVSNMNKPISPHDPNNHYYNHLRRLTVYAGSIYMNPSVYPKDAIAGLQAKEVNSFFVAYDDHDLKKFKRIRPPHDKDFNLTSILKLDVVDAAFNVGFLKVVPFQWTSSVMPLPLDLGTESLASATQRNLKSLETYTLSYPACKVAAWHFPTERKIFHHVLYTPMSQCRQAYCNYNLNACLSFPNKAYHVCFKSAYWGEPCASDTGAALFCKFFGGGNIFAILTTAINCGNDNLPCVYTTMTPIIEVYETMWEKYHPSTLAPP